jgi:hypothetical protein
MFLDWNKNQSRPFIISLLQPSIFMNDSYYYINPFLPIQPLIPLK